MYIDYQTFTCILTLDIYTGKFCYYICSTDVYRYSIDIHKHIALEFIFIIYTNPNTCTGRVLFNGYFIHTHVWILHIPEQADYLSIYVQYIYINQLRTYARTGFLVMYIPHVYICTPHTYTGRFSF